MSNLATAYHEAGHAVASWRLHVAIKRASIVSNNKDNSAGHVATRALTERACGDIECSGGNR
jgi:ATP-dependent Zn protease